MQNIVSRAYEVALYAKKWLDRGVMSRQRPRPQFSGERLRERREHHLWSQRDLARAANIAPSTVTRLENGDVSHPSWATLRRLTEALHCEYADLLNV